MSKPLVVVVLLLAALASAALVFFAMSALSDDEPPPAQVASVPTESAEEPEPEPTEAELVLRTDITDASLFVDAFERGPIEPESRRTLPLGPHRIEARRGTTVIAALTVELAAGGAEVELHADGTTTQTATPEPRVARARTTSAAVREVDAPREPASTTVAAPAEAPAPAPTAPPIAPRVATASSIEVVDQAAATTVVPAPTAPAPAPVAPAPVAPAPVAPAPMAPTVVPTSATTAPVVATMAAPAASPPSEAEMRRALDSVIAGVRQCAGDFHGELDVSATFQPDGSVRARIGRLPTRDARYCVQRVIQQGVRTRGFTGRATGFRHEYRL